VLALVSAQCWVARPAIYLAVFRAMGRESTSTTAPRLSVVIPVYRVEAYLAECLDSILSHPGDGIEVVAVNDGSPDRCGSILDEYARRDPRLRVVHLPRNVGLGQARNAGIDRATGEYVWFVDADDWLPEGAVAAVRERLAVTHPDVLIIDHAEVFESGLAVLRTAVHAQLDLTAPIHLSQRPELLRLAQSACTKVARRALLDEAGLRFLPGWYEDSSFSHPLMMAARSIDVLHEVCYCYRQRTPGGITTTVSARHFEVFDQYERLFAIVDRASGAYDVFRPELFRLMINHYLVIVGNEWRLPTGMHQAFFRRIAQDYRRWLPAGGYAVPDGVTGLKHRLVKHDAYRAYAALRLAHRQTAGVRRLLSLGEARRVGRAARAVPTPRPVMPARQRSAEMDARGGPTERGVPIAELDGADLHPQLVRMKPTEATRIEPVPYQST
jgi:glycosyltransferase involved in cell wall biosynthesis